MKNAKSNSKESIRAADDSPGMVASIAGWVRRWYWLVSIALIVLSLGLGFIGYREFLGTKATALDALYKTLKIAGMGADVAGDVPWQLEVARFATPLLFAHAVFVGLGALFWERYNLTRLLWWRNHVVICGLGKKGTLLAKEFRKQGHKVVVIDNERNNVHGEEFRFRDIIVLLGDARDEFVLRRAAVGRAKYVLALTGNDGANAEVAMLARSLAARHRSARLNCFAHILDLDLCQFLREREVESLSGSPIRVEFFCFFEMGARFLLAKHPFVDGGEAVEGSPPHIVVVGPGRFGASLIVQAARDWRNAGGTAGNRLRVTVVDRDGADRLERIRTRFPQVDSVCEFDVVPLSTLAPEFSKAAFLFDVNGRSTASIVYICLDDESAGLTAAFTLNRCCERRGVTVPIVLRMSEGVGFAAMFSDDDDASPIRAFHLLDETCMPEKLCVSTNELIAQALHNQYCKNLASKGATETADRSAVAWEQLSDRLKDSNRQQATHLATRLHQCGYQIAPLADWEAENFAFAESEIEQMAKTEHERWRKEKMELGMKYAPGPKTKKTHPDLQTWEKLDNEAQEKARNIVCAAPRVLALVGFQVEKIATFAINNA